MAKNGRKFFNKREWLLVILVLAVGSMAAVILVDLRVTEQSAGRIYANVSQAPATKVALVLGASVRNNTTMSNMLQDRADTALEFYKAGKAQKILVSGDNGHQNYNEVIVVQRYLLEQGVPKSDIFLDYAGFDTHDSLYRARDIFKVSELTIITQRFHLPRALYLAKNLGLRANGLVADRHSYIKVEFNQFREKIANLKAFFDITFHIKPKFLGDPIPIE